MVAGKSAILGNPPERNRQPLRYQQTMIATLLSLLLAAPAASSNMPTKSPATYQTSKSLPVVEKCLYEELSDLGEATFMRSAGSTILMVRNGQGAPLIIDIELPKLAITAKATPEIRARVTRCL